MTFDIHQLDTVEPGDRKADRVFRTYCDTLIDRFLASPEGARLREASPDAGFWAEEFLHFGFDYVSAPLTRITVAEVEEIVTELFPRKVSLSRPEEADRAIPELTAFWEYLKREFGLAQADAILAYLRGIARGYRQIMNDPARFGPAKSFFMQGLAEGFDMTDETDVLRFQAIYNARLASGRSAPVAMPGVSSPPSAVSKARAKEKSKRKAAKIARKRQKRGR